MKKILIILFVLIFGIRTNPQSQVLIKILENEKIKEDPTKYIMRYKFYIPIPIQFYGIPDKMATLNSFISLYPGLEGLEGNNVTFVLKDTFDFSMTDTSIRQVLNTKYSNYMYGLNNIIITTPDYMNGEIWDGTTWQCQN